LEIHQQLATKKLFCECIPTESDEYSTKFKRNLRMVKSELGQYDPAVIFESKKSKTIEYFANPESSCLVEQDEEPPHDINKEAKEIVLCVAKALHSRVFSEIYPMRKTVIDGSNTTGFQRTMLISQGGYLEANNEKIGVQSICLEEDAAKLLGDKGSVRQYSLDRLGVPLIEIALDPVDGEPKKIKEIAMTLGRLLRSTRKVTRGIGSIRQDVNVSVRDGGAVVEIKGVQQLDQLEKVIEFEAKRQHGLVLIAQKLKSMEINISKDDVYEITDTWRECKSKIIQKAIKNGDVIKAIKIKNFSGMLGYSPYQEIRLGKEIGQLVKFYGIGGVFHSDELPNYGIENEDVNKVKDVLKMNENDLFIAIAAPSTKIDYAIESVISRIKDAKDGVPAETRMATQDGTTVFLRPRPGSSRMYPETDIPPLIVSERELEIAKKNIPKPWHESIAELEKKFKLNHQLAEQIYDSPYIELFEKITKKDSVSPTFVASVLCSTITSLERNGLDSKLLNQNEIIKAFEFLSEGKISKESIEILFENIMAGKSKTIKEAMEKSQIKTLSDSDVNDILDEIIENNKELIKNQKERAVGPLMGIAMKKLRGKTSGESVNRLLLEKINQSLK
ncbi:MAG: Glu-tRNA(Gln) amidotransferase subunit GatE, partial [Nitrosopumilaceae archaeon]|nr:Glu-tRNA(Gln) amidotransferase subunit GatE [Nitrosopumilaceae archaeon]